MKKRIFALICALIIITTVFAACTKATGSKDDKLKIVCTTFPQYDWVMQILGEKASLWDTVLLIDSGTDLHNYQPSAEDIVTVNSADLFIYVGGESDGWVEDIFNSDSIDTVRIDLMQVLGDGLLEAGHDHGDEEHDDHGEDCEHQHDEHVWLSLDNAEIFCETITDALCGIDPANKQTYEENGKIYTEKLESLDEKYEETVDTAKYNTLVFADRFPFAYLCVEYDIHAHAAFSGCSAETEASFETINELSKELDSAGVGTVIIIDGSDSKLAETVISNTVSKNQKILILDSMQSVTRNDVDAGISYLDKMESNLEVLAEALN